MKKRYALLLAIPVICLFGCKSKKTAEEAPEPESPFAQKAATEKKSSALSSFRQEKTRPSLLNSSSFSDTEREIIRSQESERAREKQKMGPGIYDKESKARKDWVF